MTVQITVRLPDELVEFLDDEVKGGKASSRADSVAAALRQVRQTRAAERDAEIYARLAEQGDDDPELAAWTEHASRTPLTDLD